MKNQTIYIFGNPLLPFDSLPVRLTPKLRKIFPEIKFVIKDPNENLKPKNGELQIIDTIAEAPRQLDSYLSLSSLSSRVKPGMTRNAGIASSSLQIRVITKLDNIQLDKIYSAHDFDLGFNLKLLQKVGELKKVIIFGVPASMDEEEALKQLSNKISEKLKK